MMTGVGAYWSRRGTLGLSDTGGSLSRSKDFDQNTGSMHQHAPLQIGNGCPQVIGAVLRLHPLQEFARALFEGQPNIVGRGLHRQSDSTARAISP